MRKRGTIIVVLCCIVLLMLIGICVINSTRCDSSGAQVKTQTGRGIITDRNGVVLVANDTISCPDSTGMVAVRIYPHPIAPHVIGRIEEATQADIDYGYSDYVGEIIGKDGVEKFYDKMLKAVDGKSGKNLKLTIDYDLQKLGEELMNGKMGGAVAIEPSTGEVLCMASSPTYNPQLLSGAGARSNWQSLLNDSLKPLPNRCLMAAYAPGGVFAVAQSLVLMSEGFMSPQAQYTIENVSQSYLDMMSDAKYGTVQCAMEKWREYMVSFGFGHKLGIDLPHERRGMIPDANYYDKAYKGRWTGMMTLGNAIGQGEICTTLLQLANFSATIANWGHYYTPHVVKEIEGETIDEQYKSVQSTMVSPEVYDAVIQWMRQCVQNGSCGELSKLPIESCGLSGTASVREHNNSVFIGFAPVDKPKIAVAVYIGNGGLDGQCAASIGGRLMEYYLQFQRSKL